MNLEELKEREERLFKSEIELKRKRKRDKIADLFIVVAILGVTFYNSIMIKQSDLICTQKYEEMILGSKKDNFNSNISDYELTEKLKEMNITCLTH